jgi:hypothetical protein
MRTYSDIAVINSDNVIGDSIHLEDRPGIEIGSYTVEEMQAIWESYRQPYRPSFTCNVEARLDSNVKHLIRRVRETIVDFKKIDG